MFHPYLIALLTLLLLSLTARAQCPGGASFTGPEIPGVNSNQITAMLDWDPDGAGPLPSRLLVSGDFTLAGSVAAGGMATWDGSEWAAFPVPLASVNALTTFDGDLIAAPANANPAPVVRWDAAAGAWQPMGSTLLAPVNALAVFNSQLYAGGTGLRPGIGGLRPVARWNGTAWQGVTTLSYGTIHALHVYNNLLYLGGGESTGSLIVAAFNGSSTTTYPINCGCAVRSFATHNGLLYMGTTGFNPVKVFDGTTWQSANFGVFTYTTTPAVYSMRSFDGDLYVGGDFVTSYAGSEVNNLARLRNGTWQQIHPHGSCFSKVLSLVPFQHVLVIGTSTSDDLSSPSGIAAYGAGGLSALSSALDGFVAAAVNFDNGTVYAGSFMRAGAAILNGAGRYAAGDWTPIGDGPGIASQHAVVHNGDLYVAGLGLDLPGLPVRRWDGAAWSTLGTGTQRFASIQGLESLNGDLFVAGISARQTASMPAASPAGTGPLGTPLAPSKARCTPQRSTKTA